MGWGKILAEARIFAEPEHPGIPCPLCGEEMSWEQVSWFCRSGPWRPSGISREPCSEDPGNTRVQGVINRALTKFHSLPRGEGGAEDGFQFFFEPWGGVPAVHAVLLWNDEVLATAGFRRGHRGVRNFAASPTPGHAPEEVVEAMRQGAQWTLAPWFENEEAG